MASTPSPQTPTTPSPWWKRLCRVGWIGLRFFWETIVVGLVLNALVSLAFLSRGAAFQSLYFWPILDWMQHNPFLTGLITLVLLGLTWLAWYGSRHGENTPREQAHRSAPTTRDRTILLRFLGNEYRRQLDQSLQRAAMMELDLQGRTDVISSPAQLVSWHLDAPEERSLPTHASIVEAYDEWSSFCLGTTPKELQADCKNFETACGGHLRHAARLLSSRCATRGYLGPG